MNNKKVLIISKVRTHPVKMGNNKAILAQAEKLIEIGCNVDLEIRKRMNALLFLQRIIGVNIFCF